ncbi:MAG: FG-GAP repeat protein, partial [Nanoarchaeota archaeon]|nr:FG-GAP repeat protein [Nanoarchaeota archaeon]
MRKFLFFLFFLLFILMFVEIGFGINISEIGEVNSSNAETTGLFGNSASVSGDYAIVGAYAENAPLGESGRAYVFKRNVSDDSFYEVAVLNSSNPESSGFFGNSVSISGDYAIVGVSAEDAPLSASGRAYVFKRNVSDDSFYELDILNSSNPEASGNFGKSVSISGDYIVVGALYEDAPLAASGRAYVFKRNISDDSFYELDILNSSNPEISGLFGYGVSISGDYVVVGAYAEDAPLSGSGRAYVFKRNLSDDSFYQVSELNSSNPEINGNFGTSVSISGDYVVVGVPYEDAPISGSGRAY